MFLARDLAQDLAITYDALTMHRVGVSLRWSGDGSTDTYVITTTLNSVQVASDASAMPQPAPANTEQAPNMSVRTGVPSPMPI